MQPKEPEIIYPDSDGQPMADSTTQYRWITKIKGGCDAIFKENENVFIAGDLLWYPVEGKPQICQSPDTMVVFGRPKGDRSSYRQWREDNMPPQVVFEIRSHNDSDTKMAKKFSFYQRYGVEEYYLYDPESNNLQGWQRIEGLLEVIEPMNNWVSPRLGIKFAWQEEGLEIYAPNGESLVDYVDLYAQKELEKQEKELAQQRAEQERQRAEKLLAQLRAAGIEPEE